MVVHITCPPCGPYNFSSSSLSHSGLSFSHSGLSLSQLWYLTLVSQVIGQPQTHAVIYLGPTLPIGVLARRYWVPDWETYGARRPTPSVDPACQRDRSACLWWVFFFFFFCCGLVVVVAVAAVAAVILCRYNR